MKKKLSIIGLVLCTVALLFACGGKEEEGAAKDYVKVGKYEGLEIEKIKPVAVTAEEVEAAIRTDLLALGKEVKGPAAMNDTVTMDYLGKVDGVAFEGGEAKDASLDLGSGDFIPGFEEKIVGHNVDETFDIDVTFPADYHSADLAGKAAVFTITLKKIVRLPELTEDLLPQLGTKAKTVKEYKKEVEDSLKELNKEAAQSQNQQLIIEALAKVCEMKDYPTSRLIRVTKELVYQESYGAMMSYISIDDAVTQTYGKNVEEQAKELLMTELAVEYIADKEEIVVSVKEHDEKVAELAAMYGETNPEAFLQSYESVYGEGYIKRMMLQEKVAAFLLKSSKDVKAKSK